MTENPSGVTRHNPRPRTRTIMLAACVVGIVVVAALGVWYFVLDSSECESVPSLVLQQEDFSKLTFTVNDTARNDVPWGDVIIKLEATPTDSGASYTYAYWEWRPSKVMLTSQDGMSITRSINASTTNAPMIICNLTDFAGNGVVNDGDSFTLMPVGNDVILAGVPCKITFLYLPMMESMGSLEFTP